MNENRVTANAKYAAEIGLTYAQENNEVQAKLLDGFLHGLNVGCQYKPDAQMNYIVDEMDSKHRKLLIELAEFAKLAEEN